MAKNKEDAYPNYIKMIEHSWTWGKLTDHEKENCYKAFEFTHLSGTYEKRCEQLSDVYHAFLFALDYNPIDWRRSKEESDAPLF